MSKRLLIHIGPHKTGSTAIQHALLENSEQLKDHGVVYPQVGFRYYGHHQLVSLLARPDNGSLSEIADQLREMDEETVVLSSENFSSCSLAELQHLAELLSSFSRIEVVVYLRSFLELLYPWWQELVKHRIADDLGGFLVNSLTRPFQTHLLDAAGMIEKFAATFDGNVSVYLYDAVMRQSGDAARHFMCEILGIEPCSKDLRVAVNKSLDPASAELVRCLNSSGEYGITVLERNADAQALCADIRSVAESYKRRIALSYEQYVPRQMELNLIRSLQKHRLTPRPERAGHSTEIFERRHHDIFYLDPSLWLMEPELAARARTIIEDVKCSRPRYVQNLSGRTQ
ncbi:MAG TPA: hypothetical protein VFX06_15995 [Stellaceae bacterium]|nr:hypothetical protein [Stellaceae bacterium]